MLFFSVGQWNLIKTYQFGYYYNDKFLLTLEFFFIEMNMTPI